MIYLNKVLDDSATLKLIKFEKSISICIHFLHPTCKVFFFQFWLTNQNCCCIYCHNFSWIICICCYCFSSICQECAAYHVQMMHLYKWKEDQILCYYTIQYYCSKSCEKSYLLSVTIGTVHGLGGVLPNWHPLMWMIFMWIEFFHKSQFLSFWKKISYVISHHFVFGRINFFHLFYPFPPSEWLIDMKNSKYLRITRVVQKSQSLQTLAAWFTMCISSAVQDVKIYSTGVF